MITPFDLLRIDKRISGLHQRLVDVASIANHLLNTSSITISCLRAEGHIRSNRSQSLYCLSCCCVMPYGDCEVSGASMQAKPHLDFLFDCLLRWRECRLHLSQALLLHCMGLPRQHEEELKVSCPYPLQELVELFLSQRFSKLLLSLSSPDPPNHQTPVENNQQTNFEITPVQLPHQFSASPFSSFRRARLRLSWQPMIICVSIVPCL